MIIKKYPFDITKSIFSSDTYKTVGTQQSKIKFKKITTKEIKTPAKKVSNHEEFLNEPLSKSDANTPMRTPKKIDTVKSSGKRNKPPIVLSNLKK